MLLLSFKVPLIDFSDNLVFRPVKFNHSDVYRPTEIIS